MHCDCRGLIGADGIGYQLDMRRRRSAASADKFRPGLNESLREYSAMYSGEPI